MLTLEKILLQTIKFDLQVEHPYSYLLKYAKCLKGNYCIYILLLLNINIEFANGIKDFISRYESICR